jgi:hypothetical protein
MLDSGDFMVYSIVGSTYCKLIHSILEEFQLHFEG